MAANPAKMFSILHRISCNLKLFSHIRRCTTTPLLTELLKSNSEKFSGQEEPKFKDPEVQRLLKSLTERSLDLDKVFKPRLEPLKIPSYHLMSDDELQEAEERIKEEGKTRLEMPPVMTERKEIDMALREDPQIDGHDESNFVFTDISTSANDRNRRIVVRETNGVLREGTWEERERMNFIYLPREGQFYQLPAMLTDELLPTVFGQLRHADALDLVSLQCAPDSPDYLRVHKQAYEDIENRGAYYLLESTRHCGGMMFYFVKHNRIRGMILRMVREDRIEEAVDVVKLLHVVHTDSELAKDATDNKLEGQDLLMAYAQEQGLNDLISLLSGDGIPKANKV